MYRYIALVWPSDRHDLHPLAQFMAEKFLGHFPEWRIALKIDGMLIFHMEKTENHTQAYPLRPCDKANYCGAILGTLFSRHYIDNYQPGQYAPEIPALDSVESQQIIESGGQHLVNHYWGRYVAFITKPDSKTQYVLRDPTGGLPCHIVHHKGINLYFSDLEDCKTITNLVFSVNWKYMAAYVRYHWISSENTGLNEVSALLPGECSISEHSGSTRKEFYWNPVALSQCSPIEDVRIATFELFRTTVGCVAAWASCFKNIIHQLSGGLDSSVVLGCLSRASTKPRITCLNHYTPGIDGDERRFAQLAARYAGVDLREIPMNPNDVDYAQLTHLPTTAEPMNYGMINRLVIEAQMAETIGAEAIFSGLGGDELFFQDSVSLGAIDYAYRHSLTPRMFTIAMEAARIGNELVWPVLLSAIKIAVLKGAVYKPTSILNRAASNIVNSDIEKTLVPENFLHPFYLNEYVAPPGKLRHISGVIVPPMQVERTFQPYSVDRVLPLCSQPLIELCLRIPVDVLTVGGRSRGLLRRAFADTIPREITTRVTKGTGMSYLRKIFEMHHSFSREFLLDGILVKEKLLNKQQLEQALNGFQAHVASEHLDILNHISTELWLRQWAT